MKEAPKPAKEAFDRAIAGKAEQLRAETKEKKTGLSAKHEKAADGRKDEKEAVWNAYRQKRTDIADKYRPLLDEVKKRRPPALEIAPPGFGRGPEWMSFAKAMLAEKMFSPRRPLNQTFTRSLSRITPAQRLGVLMEKFRLVREGKDVMLPIRHTREAKRFAEKHHRPPNRQEREKEIKAARNFEMAGATVEFEQKKLSITAEHKKQAAVEKAERIILTAEIKRAWADFRKENGLPERKNEWNEQRAKNKAAFNEPAKDTREQTADIWEIGTVGDHKYRVNTVDQGLQAGRVSKLEITNDQGDRVAYYNEGWEQAPGPETRGITEQVLQLFGEMAPQLPEAEKSTEQSAEDMVRTFREAAQQDREMGW